MLELRCSTNSSWWRNYFSSVLFDPDYTHSVFIQELNNLPELNYPSVWSSLQIHRDPEQDKEMTKYKWNEVHKEESTDQERAHKNSACLLNLIIRRSDVTWQLCVCVCMIRRDPNALHRSLQHWAQSLHGNVTDMSNETPRWRTELAIRCSHICLFLNPSSTSHTHTQCSNSFQLSCLFTSC